MKLPLASLSLSLLFLLPNCSPPPAEPQYDPAKHCTTQPLVQDPSGLGFNFPTVCELREQDWSYKDLGFV